MDFSIREAEAHEWPPLLWEIPDPPQKLYVRGTPIVPNNRFLAVVGSRRGTAYGKEVVRKLIGELAGYPITIVSGLALGVDAYAHEAALRANLHTVAVPGSGIDDRVLYPRTNRALAKKILEAGGGLLSEFEPTFESTPWAFPKRNRIMAGMSHATLVIEATLKSGTLITAKLATDYNRELLVVPGSIFSSFSEGPHLFLKLGATPVTTSTDILHALRIEALPQTSHTPVGLSPTELHIYEALAEPMNRDALVLRTKLPSPDLSMHLTLLELRGVVREVDGFFYRI